MQSKRLTTIIVEPNPGGHRFQAVANVAQIVSRTDDVLLLTSRGAAATDEFNVYLGEFAMRIDDRLPNINPAARTQAAAISALSQELNVSTAVVMDADQVLKRWFAVAWQELRGLSDRKPRIVFMLTRYPARLRITDLVGWRLRFPKGLLAVAAIGTGTVHHVAGFAGRDDMARGWIVRRARDPEICTASAADRVKLRSELDLPQDRRLVGIFGVVEERKNAPMIMDALDAAGLDDVDLVLAGSVQPAVQSWINTLPPQRRARVIVRNGFLSNEILDKHVAAVDAVPIALTNNGPSGIMGKALAAGVPVVTAGSRVRARECRATDGGEVADLKPESIGAALQQVLQRDPGSLRRSSVPPATTEEFVYNLLGINKDGTVQGRSPRKRKHSS